MIKFAIRFALLCLVNVSGAMAQSNSLDIELVTVDQETFVGSLLEFTEDEVFLDITESKRNFAYDQVGEISFGNTISDSSKNAAEESGVVWTELVDGSRILTKSFSLDERDFLIESMSDVAISGETRSLSPIMFKPLDAPQTDEMWQEVVEESAKSSDGLVVSRKGKLQSIEGVIRKVSEESISFSIDDTTRDIKRSKVQGLFFFRPTQPEFEPALCQLTLIDRSTVNVRRIEVSDEKLKVVCVCGIEFETESGKIAKIDFSIGRDVYLSDLEPTSNDWAPLIASQTIVERLRPFRIARIDTAHDGSPLSLMSGDSGSDLIMRRKEFQHGFSLWGGSKLAFRLNGQFKTLSGLVGFNPKADRNGIVKMVIRVDGKTVFTKRFAHSEGADGVVDANGVGPTQVDIDISGGKRLVIVVEYEDGRNVGDNLHFVDVTLSR